MEATNAATLVLLLLPWVLWLAWELVLLCLRTRPGPKVKTISMVARDNAHRLTGVIFLWGGMGAHWWVLAKEPAPVWAGVAFWLVALGLVVSDAILWRSRPSEWPSWLRWARWPPAVLAFGFLAGRVLFPQAL